MLESTRVIRERTIFTGDSACIDRDSTISPGNDFRFRDYAIFGFGHSTAAAMPESSCWALWGKNCVIMQGECIIMTARRELAVPVRTLRELGCKTLVLTNAAGAVNKAFVPANLC